MSIQNQAGDVQTQNLVNAICDAIQELDSQKQKSDIPDRLQEILSHKLHRTVNISSRYRSRQFPQLYVQDFQLHIRYFIEKSIVEDATKWKYIFLQLSVAVVLACCSSSFVEENLSIDETFRTFSQKWPAYANMATRIYKLILTKLPE